MTKSWESGRSCGLCLVIGAWSLGFVAESTQATEQTNAGTFSGIVLQFQFGASRMSVRHQHTRRKFLKGTAAALGASAIGFPTIVPSSALGKDGAVAPSNRIVMGGIGTGGRGGNHLDTFSSMKEVQFVACCDADAGHLANGVGAVNEKYGN